MSEFFKTLYVDPKNAQRQARGLLPPDEGSLGFMPAAAKYQMAAANPMGSVDVGGPGPAAGPAVPSSPGAAFLQAPQPGAAPGVVPFQTPPSDVARRSPWAEQSGAGPSANPTLMRRFVQNEMPFRQQQGFEQAAADRWLQENVYRPRQEQSYAESRADRWFLENVTRPRSEEAYLRSQMAYGMQDARQAGQVMAIRRQFGLPDWMTDAQVMWYAAMLGNQGGY